MKGIGILCQSCLILATLCSGREVLTDLVETIEKAIAFYGDNYMDMNIDGIFGLRVLEGQLKLVVDTLKTKQEHSSDPEPLYSRLVSGYQRAKSISESSLKVLKESDQHYYQLMNFVIQQPWSFQRKYRNIDPTLRWKSDLNSNKGFPLDEKKSDKCMSEVMGNGMQASCHLSKSCLKVMSMPGFDGYVITHQLLYTMLAEQRNCSDKLNNELLNLPTRSISLEQLQAEFCANNFFETSEMVKLQNGVIHTHLQDLFLEQELVCSMLGYVEFLHIDWLQQIQSWQKPSGCFGDAEEEVPHESRNQRKEQQHRRSQQNMPNDLQAEAKQEADINTVAQLQHKFDRHVISGRSTPHRRLKPLGNLGAVDQVTPLDNSRLNPTDQNSYSNLNSKKRGYNKLRNRKRVPVMGFNPVDVERGKLGQRQIKPSLREGKGSQGGLHEFSYEQARLGDTHIKGVTVKEDGVVVDIKGKQVREQRAHADSLLPTASDEESFGINHQHINRKLLYEKTLEGGCLAHKTAVAMGALSQYLRFILLANSSGFDAWKLLNGINYLMQPESLQASSAVAISPSPDTHADARKTQLNANHERDLKQDKSSKVIDKPDYLSVKSNISILLQRTRFTSLSINASVTVDKMKKNTNTLNLGTKSDPIELYEEDLGNDIVPNNLPVAKRSADELLLYDELVKMQPKISFSSKPVDQGLVKALVKADKASHMHTLGDSSFEGITSVSSTYAFVVIVTVTILLLLYKSLRKHRSGGAQFRHSRVR